jgi:hypothetical protein
MLTAPIFVGYICVIACLEAFAGLIECHVAKRMPTGGRDSNARYLGLDVEEEVALQDWSLGPHPDRIRCFRGSGVGYRRAEVVDRPRPCGSHIRRRDLGRELFGMGTALGMMPPPERDRRGRRVVMLAAHLVYGTALALMVGRRDATHDATTDATTSS